MHNLKASRPKVALWIITIIFITTIFQLIISPLTDFLVLKPSDLDRPWNWYKLLTYPLAGNLLMWLFNSPVLLLTGYIIENHLKKKDILIIILTSSVIGGLVFIILNQNDYYNRGIASASMISCGYWAATIIIGLKFWKDLIIFERIVLILCFLSLAGFFFKNFDLGLGPSAVIVCILIFTMIRTKKIKTEN